MTPVICSIFYGYIYIYVQKINIAEASVLLMVFVGKLNY